jgi:hypothetical protein
MTKDEALKLALDALTSGDGWRQSEAIKTIEEVLAQKDSEPYGIRGGLAHDAQNKEQA